MTRGLRPLRENASMVLAAGVGFLASLFWLVELSYSRGYDLFLWVHNAWYLQESLRQLKIPNWIDLSAAGQPFFKVSGLFDCVLLAGAALPFGMWSGLKLFVLGQYVVAATGMCRLAFTITGDRASSVLAATAYVLSWFITITVYFQGYLSNFYIYAALPWFLYVVVRGLEKPGAKWLIPAGLLLFSFITTNPQVAIKVLLFALVWGFLWFRKDWNWRRTIAAASVAMLGLAVSLFNVASALIVRLEVVSSSDRMNSMHAPWDLFLLPAYALNLLSYLVLGIQPLEIELRHLRFSGYPGISVLLIAAASIWSLRRNPDSRLRDVWWLTAGLYISYWFILGLLPASPWIGISHNILVFPAFTLALAAGYGLRQLQDLGHRFGWRSGAVTTVALALLIADLGGASYCLNRYGVERTPPGSLPEIAVWRATEEHVGTGRFFSYNPDHTIYLYPTMTGKPTANVIELRQRTPEYESYLRLLGEQLRDIEHAADPSKLLSLLNVSLIDVPSKAFTYRGATRKDAPHESYVTGLERFYRDPDLTVVHQRSQTLSDGSWDRLSTRVHSVLRQPHRPDLLAQTVFVNHSAVEAFIPPQVVVIEGNSLEAEGKFEQAAVQSWFRPTAIGYLLITDAEDLPDPSRDPLRHAVVWQDEQTGIPSSVRELYRSGSSSAERVGVWRAGPERIEISIDRADRDRFVFLSKQFFQSWKAATADGLPIPAYKAGAGLTAIAVPAGTERIVFTYALDAHERYARWISIGALLAAAACWIRSVCRPAALQSQSPSATATRQE